MRNNLTKILALLLLVCTIVTSFASCQQITDIVNGLLGNEPGEGTGGGEGDGGGTEHVHVDYVSTLKLDMSSDTIKQEVTVKMFIDGDTTHFYVPKTVMERGYIKARYLAAPRWRGSPSGAFSVRGRRRTGTASAAPRPVPPGG